MATSGVPQGTHTLAQSSGHTRSHSVDLLGLAAPLETIAPALANQKKQLRFSSQAPEVREIAVDHDSRKARMSYDRAYNLTILEDTDRTFDRPTKLSPLQHVKSRFGSASKTDASHDVAETLKNHAQGESDPFGKLESVHASPMQNTSLQSPHTPLSAIEKFNRLTPEEQFKHMLSGSKLSKDRDREISALINKTLEPRSGKKTVHKIIPHQALHGKHSGQMGMQGIDLKQLRTSGTQSHPNVGLRSSPKK
jgi:hypothetical protein